MAEQKKAPQGPGAGPRGGYQKPKNMGKTVKRLLSYVAQRKLPLLVILLCLALSTLASVGGSYLLRPVSNLIVDPTRTVGEKVSGLLALLALMGAIYILGAAATYFQAFTMVHLAQRGISRLRHDLFQKLQSLPLKYFDQHTHGELMSRFSNDADNVQMALEQSLISLLSSALLFVSTIVVMIVISPLLFLLTILVLFGAFLIIKTWGGRSRRFYQKQQAALGDVNGNIQEMIEGLKVVKAFTHEDIAKEQFAQLNETYRQAASTASFCSTATGPLMNNLFNIGFALTAGLGGVLAAFAGFDIGGLVSYLTYCRQIGQPMNQFSMQLTTILSALAGAERIFEVMDTEPEIDEGEVTLVPVEKDANGSLSKFSGQGRPRAWAWKVPRSCGLTLVPVLSGSDETLYELGQADEENGKLKLLPPGQDSQTGLWVRIEGDGSLTPLTLEAMAGHGWAWKYPDPDGVMGLHLIRGAVRNVPGEEFCYTELRGAVRLNHVDFSYVEGKRVLNDVTVYANPGQKIAFVGSTGAGKTTITNLINRFYEIQGGTITYDGINVRDIKKDDLRRSLGAVLQDTHLFTGTVMDNIRYGRLEATDEECIAAAKTANAHSFIRRLPDGYNTMVVGDGANLSQGQRQLLGIARAAVKDPPVMILDEATSSIDTRTERYIEKGMDALMENRTVFVIAHRLSTVRNSNCITVIEGGQIMEKGDHAELLEQKGRYYQLYTGQFQLD